LITSKETQYIQIIKEEQMIRKYEIIETEDGSHTLRLADTAVTFHSNRGAIQESAHIFIQSAFDYFIQNNPSIKELRIFEVGFGTGLNALLTAIAARRNGRQVVYRSIDLYPLAGDIFSRLNYAEILNERELYKTIMQTPWEQLIYIDPFFKLQKINIDLAKYEFTTKYDLIYFDAFAPEDQQEIWDFSIFVRLFNALESGGVLVTYCSKTIIRKTLESAGFVVEKIPGPRGKREIVRARKP
jgi:tRNA U34 5-methylaminomethyl-2-thiouridine-forming methyltransferase MnmC